ncbi:hypothetical protein BG003_000106 [Podila horticola]|nr:hypothetical protein BG003_000106 [Podila horticola]
MPSQYSGTGSYSQPEDGIHTMNDAESIGIIALNYTIVDVGNGFYPLVGRKHFYWRLSMAIIAAYGALGLVDVALYIPTMVTWVSNHSATFRIYSGLIIAFCLNPELPYIFSIQALDLCIRAALGSVFILPSPKFLLQFYKRHFTRFEAPPPSPMSKFRQRIRRDNPTTRRGSFSDLDDDDEDDGGDSRGRYNYNTPSRFSPDRSRIEMASEASVERPQSRLSEAHTIEPLSVGPRSYSPRISSLNGNNHASQGSNLGRLRIFPARVRGTSTESSKVFNQDFGDMDDTEEPGQPRESFRQERVPEITMNVDPETDDPTLHPADIMRGYVTEYYYFPHPSRAHLEQKDRSQDKGNPANDSTPLKKKDPSSDGEVVVSVPQKLEPVLLTPDRMTGVTPTVALSSDKPEYLPAVGKPEDIKPREDSMDITGTTGWEIGGWLSHVAERSVSPTNLSHPLETSEAQSPPLSPLSATSSGSARNSRQFLSPSPTLGRQSYDRDCTQSTQPRFTSRSKTSKGDLSDNEVLDTPYTTTPQLQELTGLQKQLAESRSALFPIVMAMAEQDREDGYDVYAPPSLTLLSTKDAIAYRVDFESDPPPRPPADMQHMQLGPTASDTLLTLFGPGMGRSGLQPANEEHITPESYRLPTAIPVASPAPKMSKSDKNVSPAQAPAKKSWLMGRKAQDPALQYMSKKSDSQLMSVPESSGSSDSSSHSVVVANTSTNNAKSTTNSNVKSATNNAKSITETQPTKVRENKPREGRLAALSKALTGGSNKGVSSQGSGQRHGRPSQDVVSGDQGDSSSAYGGDSLAPAIITVPTVKDLVLVSTEDDNDQGLQYYFPDPYSHLTEFKRPPPLNLGQSHPLSGTAGDRSSSSQLRHPLSPTFDINDSDTTKSSGANGYGGVVGSDTSSVRQVEDGSMDGASTKGSTKSATKLGLPKKSLLRDTKTNTDLDANSQTNAHPSNPLGSLLSRSASGSKKLGSKIMAGRGTRSKSDVVPDRPSIEHGRIISSPLIELPITVTRKPAPMPVMPQPAHTSLSPPPRQTWARSKSFQGTTAAISAALTAHNNGLDLPTSESTDMSINTRLVNKDDDGQDPLSPGSTASSRSPPLSPISLNEYGLTNTAPRVLGSKMSRLGTTGTHSRNHSLESTKSTDGRVSLPSSPTSPSFAKDRLGFSTAAMDLRRATNRHQRSVDNLATSYYYKRAAELSQASPPPSTPLPNPPTSPLANGGGYSYYNAPSGDNSTNSSVRNSPSNPYGPASTTSAPGAPMPTHYFHTKSGSSPQATAVGSGMNVPAGYESSMVDPFPRSNSGLGGSAMGVSLSNDSRTGASGSSRGGVGSLGGRAPSRDGADSRTNSISSVQLKDDQWTQSMVERALAHQRSGVRIG